MSKRRGVAVLVCLAILFCVFALNLSGPLLLAPPAIVCALLIVLTVSLRVAEPADKAPQPIALLRLSGSRAPPRTR